MTPFRPDRRTIECWGRNGYFWLTECIVTCGKGYGCVIDFFSRISDRPPAVQLIGSKEDLLSLLRHLTEEVEKTEYEEIT